MPTAERRPDGWQVSEFPTHAYADRNGRGWDDTEVDVDATGVSITMRGGYAYEGWQGSTFIPTEVMVEVMRRAGFTVTREGE